MNKIQKKLENIRESLYWKISGFFFLILVMLGVAYTFITIMTAKRYSDETTQKLNANVADQLLQEVSPFVEGKVNEESLGKIMHSMMAVNPGLEVYLLDPQGKILSFVVLHKKVKLEYVAVEPIKKFLSSKGKSLIYGDDPRNPGRSKIFSATAVYEHGQLLGYVYLILASEEYENTSVALQESYLLKIGVQSFVITLTAASLIALVILWLLMRSLRGIVETVKRFGEGDLSPRIPIRSKGELAQLALTINMMADTILRNMDELKEVDKLRRDLIANVSHDIRTPISIIHGYIETLIIKHDTLDSKKQEEYLRIILKSTERLKRLMSDLFELSKLESRQVKPKLEVFFISDLLQDLDCKYKLLAQEKNIDLQTDFASRSPMVRADVAMIERVLQNLMDNALNYTPENGQVRIRMEKEERKIRVSVSNTGRGILPQDMPKIFDRYYKVENNRTNRGTGLGLAIVKNILEIHKTDIRVQSEQYGNTTFSFDLPVAVN
ncbi:sensor histidine kinase [Chryseolinea soli]|uniref:histidine kinase n=1 Tax=Chryseolinea soli TaxID=2321403 RepID=A0A385SVB8_9BACT|nr:ATP-binding protein [Chryseolinea soli]AYB35793.1 HAMP domain-containing protein [Chryseolinea soli]